MSFRSNSGASEVGLTRFGLRIILAMHPSTARGKTAGARGALAPPRPVAKLCSSSVG